MHELLRSASVLHSVKRYNAIGDPVSRCRPENHRRLLTLLKSDAINYIFLRLYFSSPLSLSLLFTRSVFFPPFFLLSSSLADRMLFQFFQVLVSNTRVFFLRFVRGIDECGDRIIKKQYASFESVVNFLSF